MVSYKDIQLTTGLSLATISKYFNGGNVRPANREAIDAAVAIHGYRPNAIARGLRSGKSRTVGVLLPALDNDFHLTIIASVEQRLREVNIGVVVATSPSADAATVDLLLGRRVDGIVAVPSPHDVDALSRAAGEIPVVALDWRAPGLDVDGVFLDNRAAGQLAARHLRSHGHTAALVLSPEPPLSSVAARVDGFLAELGPGGVSLAAPLSVDGARDAVASVLASVLGPTDAPTAFFAPNYELTLGALIAINESGRILGRDVSLIGFDGTDLARASRPRLTIIEQPMREIAEEAARTVLDLLQGERAPARERLLAPRLNAGASVARVTDTVTD
ncbi:LacI family DNA-binding transcriptional regulator [Homoserinibacter sp. GY 40078]|uniref:LacI family DNA-binding transcriptional regulator n=1 Tax=Homoserinibacter sp. GY 40078 TaxID=2603275 RepID=UPI0011C963E4|nr:LacI family DNA-binding transcriptional regulator [Homoserinibacter sp. GY 40078]TXK19383.1 LacI family transcriptional regulator [Homoserinibacter sp. GY 40078]